MSAALLSLTDEAVRRTRAEVERTRSEIKARRERALQRLTEAELEVDHLGRALQVADLLLEQIAIMEAGAR